MERYVCIHGHFYQPPRENPWLEAVELQDSAYPYHDWNERIAAECYAPNGAARVLNGNGFIRKIENNYGRISFNFGPTLLSWLEQQAPDVYESIQQADKESRERYSGHGSAMAQVYNHMIMPLASRRDKITQVRWGIRDFEHRFGRAPEGMWLAECAVDNETLDLLAEHGIRYTVLAPGQARRVRKKKAGKPWHDVTGARIDPTKAYECRLSSGRRIALFFYDGPISQAVAFEGLLASGERFAGRILSGFSEKRDWPQLMHIATDGETYGHHHHFGDMALAYALENIDKGGLAKLTNYGEYLERFPPTDMVEVVENSSWSCYHGIERWRDNCGCNSGGHGEWNQSWRGPLREALDWLRDELAPRFEALAGQYLKDPWEARNDYIDVILERSEEAVERFLSRHAGRELNEEETVRVLKLMELQRHAMLMYTSCGWFFDELSGIETVQVIHYAGRCVQLAQELFTDNLEEGFIEMLQEAKSNIAEYGNGADIYRRWVKPAIVGLPAVTAHYAISGLFESYSDDTRVYAFDVHREQVKRFEVGNAKLIVGKARVVSEVTHEAAALSFGALHLGGHNLSAGVRYFISQEALEVLSRDTNEAMTRGDFPEVIRLFDKHFGELGYSLKSLFRDEQRKVLNSILGSTLNEAGSALRLVYESNAGLMNYLISLGAPLPAVLRSSAEFVLNISLRESIEAPAVDLPHIMALLRQVELWKLTLDEKGLAYALKQRIIEQALAWHEAPTDLETLQRLISFIDVGNAMAFEVDFWRAQNLYYDILKNFYPAQKEAAETGEEEPRQWIELFRSLGEKLRITVE